MTRLLAAVPSGEFPHLSDETLLKAFDIHMRTARLSPYTVEKRLDACCRLSEWLRRDTTARAAKLDTPAGLERLSGRPANALLLDATPHDLERYQQSLGHLARNSIEIYSRHIVALYRWAVQYDYLETDPTGRMVKIQKRQGLPHPIKEKDLRLILASSRGGLRMAYILAAFAGLRCGEITRLRGEDLTLDTAEPEALIQGKGGKERIVPLLPPVVAELRAAGFPRRGPVAAQQGGTPYAPKVLSIVSCTFMQSLGVASTLHSCRHYFATEIVKLTKDLLLVRDLLGHASLATTQIYTLGTIDGAQDRLAAFSDTASGMLGNTPGTAASTVVDTK